VEKEALKRTTQKNNGAKTLLSESRRHNCVFLIVGRREGLGTGREGKSDQSSGTARLVGRISGGSKKGPFKERGQKNHIGNQGVGEPKKTRATLRLSDEKTSHSRF